jgi:ribosomal protein L29
MSKKKNTFATDTVEDLRKALAEKREALRAFRFSAKGSRVRNTKEGSLLRKDIARILFSLGSKKHEEVTL